MNFSGKYCSYRGRNQSTACVWLLNQLCTQGHCWLVLTVILTVEPTVHTGALLTGFDCHFDCWTNCAHRGIVDWFWLSFWLLNQLCTQGHCWLVLTVILTVEPTVHTGALLTGFDSFWSLSTIQDQKTVDSFWPVIYNFIQILFLFWCCLFSFVRWNRSSLHNTDCHPPMLKSWM